MSGPAGRADPVGPRESSTSRALPSGVTALARRSPPSARPLLELFGDAHTGNGAQDLVRPATLIHQGRSGPPPASATSSWPPPRYNRRPRSSGIPGVAAAYSGGGVGRPGRGAARPARAPARQHQAGQHGKQQPDAAGGLAARGSHRPAPSSAPVPLHPVGRAARRSACAPARPGEPVGAPVSRPSWPSRPRGRSSRPPRPVRRSHLQRPLCCRWQ